MNKKFLHKAGLFFLIISLLCGCNILQEKQENKPTARMKVSREEEIAYALPKIGEAIIGSGQKEILIAVSNTQSVQELPIKGSITVATVGSPNTEILQKAAVLMREQGYELIIEECTDYDTPNNMVLEGTADCNFFQHSAYLERYNRNYQTSLVEVGKVYYEPMIMYAGTAKSIEEIKEGAKIGVPSNVTGYAQALFLLKQEGLITLMSDADLRAEEGDIASNPLKLELVKMEEGEIKAALTELDAGIFHKGYAVQQGENPNQGVLAEEEKTTMTAKELSQILVIADGLSSNVSEVSSDNKLDQESEKESQNTDSKEANDTEAVQESELLEDNNNKNSEQNGNKKDEIIHTLMQVLSSEKMQEFMNQQYQGSFVLYTENNAK